MDIREELLILVKQSGAAIYECVNISMLSLRENRGYQTAILVGFLLSPQYIHKLSTDSTSDYTEFSDKEKKADQLAEQMAAFLSSKGYLSYAQSEANLGQHKEFNMKTKRTPLPHKTIAVLAGIGWIGKDNLLVTKKYGSAICMSTVLTNAPIKKEKKDQVESRCGGCQVCKEVCPTGAILGRRWRPGRDRDQLIDIKRCECCLKCLASCPWTVAYAKNKVVSIDSIMEKSKK